MFVLYVVRELEVTPALLGIIVASSGVAALFGPGPAMMWGQLVIASGSALLPLAGGPVFVAVPLLILTQVFLTFGVRVFSVNQISLRQALTPSHLLGRVNATRRVIVFGIAPMGALIGGTLGMPIGLRPAMWIGALIALLAFFAIVFSPLRSLRESIDLRRS